MSHHNPAVWTYTCPGSGDQVIQSLQMWGKSNGGTAGYGRIGIYDHDGATLLCQSESVLVNSTTAQWWGTTSPANTAPANHVLTGGAYYILAYHWSSTDVLCGSDSGANFWCKYNAQSYASGFPASLSTGSNQANKYGIRCGVDPAASGLSIPVAMRSYRQRRIA
jgi:hypothetical protein